MRKCNANNERIKRAYFEYMSHAKGMSEKSIDLAAASISNFEAFTNYRDFKKFKVGHAAEFRRSLIQQANGAVGKPLARATIHARLMALKAFFKWLAGRSGYRSKIDYSDADYFQLTANDERIAKAARQRPVPTFQEIRKAIRAMAVETPVERRDRAVIAFTLLSGMRDNAISSLSIKHVDLMNRTIFQDAREVRTKRAKTFTSWFFPVGDDIEQIVVDWVRELDREGFGPNAPLFPKTKLEVDGRKQFRAVGLSKKHWATAGPIREIFKAAFAKAGLPYYHPHSFRHAIVRHLETLPLTPEQWRACSQNFGHSSPMTTFTSYGTVQEHRQGEILNGMAVQKPDASKAELLNGAQIAQLLSALASKFPANTAD